MQEVYSALSNQNFQPYQPFRLVNLDADSFVETAAEFMRPISLDTAGEQPFRANLKVFQLAGVNLHRMSLSKDMTIKGNPLDSGLSLDIPIIGQWKNLRLKSDADTFLVDQSASISALDEPFHLALSNNGKKTCLVSITINSQILQDHIFKLTGSSDSVEKLQIPPRINWRKPVSASLQRYLGFMWNELEQDSACWRSRRDPRSGAPLVMMQMRDTFLTMFWEASQENLGHESELDKEICKPSYIRLAQAYIEACVADPISIADIASAAGIHAHTLYKGFRTYLNTTPKAYLKRKRLECARRSLLEASPDCTYVADIALKWGFSNLGHFAADYRQAFGELPSETLRS